MQGTGSSGDAHTRTQRVAGVLLRPSAERAGSGADAAGVTLLASAPIVLSCGGSLHTPALLLRSGVRCGGNVGAHLRLHPATGIVARFDRPPAGVAAPAQGFGTVGPYEVGRGLISTSAAHQHLNPKRMHA